MERETRVKKTRQKQDVKIWRTPNHVLFIRRPETESSQLHYYDKTQGYTCFPTRNHPMSRQQSYCPDDDHRYWISVWDLWVTVHRYPPIPSGTIKMATFRQMRKQTANVDVLLNVHYLRYIKPNQLLISLKHAVELQIRPTWKSAVLNQKILSMRDKAAHFNIS